MISTGSSGSKSWTGCAVMYPIFPHRPGTCNRPTQSRGYRQQAYRHPGYRLSTPKPNSDVAWPGPIPDQPRGIDLQTIAYFIGKNGASLNVASFSCSPLFVYHGPMCRYDAQTRGELSARIRRAA